MNTLVYIVSALLIISKFLDCYTTSKNIQSVAHESNPIARKLMNKFGIKTTIWAIFVLTIFIVIFSLFLINSLFNTFTYKLLFVLTGLFVSVIQFAAAHSNKNQRLNFITRLIFSVASRLK